MKPQLSAQIDASNADLKEIPVNQVDRNPENPRIVFRPGEMEQLLESIRLHGVQVPISVYREGGRYVLIDGERRWRCSLKLNKKTIPALVQGKPDALTNLLLMFNIHTLREQWDLLTIAMKLPRVINLLGSKLGHPPKVREIAEHTGVPLALIRRSKLLVDLPDEFKQELLTELKKPKTRHAITEDLFIEMERSLITVERALPSLIKDKNVVRRILIDKYKSGIIKNVVHFRKLAKIARAEKVDISLNVAESALRRLFQRNDVSIETAYEASVASAYSERDLQTRINSLVEILQHLEAGALEPDLKRALRKLDQKIRALLKAE